MISTMVQKLKALWKKVVQFFSSKDDEPPQDIYPLY